MKYRVLILLWLLMPAMIVGQKSPMASYCTQSHLEYRFTTNTYDFEHGGWVLVFEDNFEQGQIDTTKWYTCEDGWNRIHGACGEELQYYQDGNVEVENGVLKLVARQENCVHLDNCGNCLNYSSGWIQTKARFRYGYIEARCKIPQGVGFWPALWLYGNGNEIDVFEFYGDEQNKCYTDIHQWPQNYHCSERYSNKPFYDGFHVYGMEWNEFYVAFYFDGELERTIYKYTAMSGQHVPDANTYVAQNILAALDIYPDSAQSLIINLALSSGNGDHAGPNSNTVFPSTMEVDYVRVYKRSNEYRVFDIDIYNPGEESYYTGQSIGVASNANVAIEGSQQFHVYATDGIVLYPGFNAKAGSEFNASIATGITPNVRSFDDSFCFLPIGGGADCDSSNMLLFPDNVYQDTTYSAATDGENISVFPNPSTGTVYIQPLDKALSIKDVRVSDYAGNSVDCDMSRHGNGVKIAIPRPGIYVARVMANNGEYVKQIVVK